MDELWLYIEKTIETIYGENEDNDCRVLLLENIIQISRIFPSEKS